jgi:hypothetical protein
MASGHESRYAKPLDLDIKMPSNNVPLQTRHSSDDNSSLILRDTDWYGMVWYGDGAESLVSRPSFGAR